MKRENEKDKFIKSEKIELIDIFLSFPFLLINEIIKIRNKH